MKALPVLAIERPSWEAVPKNNSFCLTRIQSEVFVLLEFRHFQVGVPWSCLVVPAGPVEVSGHRGEAELHRELVPGAALQVEAAPLPRGRIHGHRTGFGAASQTGSEN